MQKNIRLWFHIAADAVSEWNSVAVMPFPGEKKVSFSCSGGDAADFLRSAVVGDGSGGVFCDPCRMVLPEKENRTCRIRLRLRLVDERGALSARTRSAYRIDN